MNTFLNLTLIFSILLLLMFLKTKQRKHSNKIKKMLKQTKLVFKSKFKNRFVLSGVNLYVYGKLLKNYKIAYFKYGVKLIKNKFGGRVVITKIANKLLFSFKNLNNIIVAFWGEAAKFSVLYKTDNVKLAKRKYYSHIKHTIVLKLSVMQTCSFGFILRFFNGYPQILHSTTKTKQTSKLLNQKIVKTLNTNAVLIKNYNQPISNIFNLKINSLIYSKNKVLVNKTYLLEHIGGFIKISKLGTNNLFNFLPMFSLKVETKNKVINNLINNVLPNKIVSEYLNNFNFVQFINLLNVKQQFKHYYTHEITNLLKRKQYLNLYNFLLTQVLGIGIGVNELYFYKPQFYLGKIYVSYQNTKLLINNNIDNCNVVYNGVVYNNVPAIKTNKTKVYNIDKII